MTFTDVPGFASVSEDRGETTLVVETAQLRQAALYLRDERGFSALRSDCRSVDLGFSALGRASCERSLDRSALG